MKAPRVLMPRGALHKAKRHEHEATQSIYIGAKVGNDPP